MLVAGTSSLANVKLGYTYMACLVHVMPAAGTLSLLRAVPYPCYALPMSCQATHAAAKQGSSSSNTAAQLGAAGHKSVTPSALVIHGAKSHKEGLSTHKHTLIHTHTSCSHGVQDPSGAIHDALHQRPASTRHSKAGLAWVCLLRAHRYVLCSTCTVESICIRQVCN